MLARASENRVQNFRNFKIIFWALKLSAHPDLNLHLYQVKLDVLAETLINLKTFWNSVRYQVVVVEWPNDSSCARGQFSIQIQYTTNANPFYPYGCVYNWVYRIDAKLNSNLKSISNVSCKQTIKINYRLVIASNFPDSLIIKPGFSHF